MAFAYSRLTQITTIANAAAEVYTLPASTTAYIRSIILHNTNTTAETVILYNVPDNAGAAGTAADANTFYEVSLSPNETHILEFAIPGIMLVDENDTIQATTTTASKVTIQIYGGTE